MRLNRLLFNPVSALVLVSCGLTTLASADTIAWTNWTSANASGAVGTIGSLTMTYSGANIGLANATSWTPVATYTGGVVGNNPPAANKGVALTGGTNLVETITFSAPVADPIFAIWSLGQGGAQASFVFPNNEPFTVVGGGPNAEFGGTALTVAGNVVSGREGNGLIQFNGVFSSISFVTPQFENYYAFTIGEDDTLTAQLTDNSTVPEPATLSLFGLGLTAIPLIRRRLTRQRQ